MAPHVVAHADRAALARPMEVDQRVPRFHPGTANWPRDEVEVHVVHLHPVEALLTRPDRVAVPMVAVPQLRRHEHVLTWDAASADATPTSASLPYSFAVSISRYPRSRAYRTAFCVAGPAGICHTPRPTIGIPTPLFRGIRAARLRSTRWRRLGTAWRLTPLGMRRRGLGD